MCGAEPLAVWNKNQSQSGCVDEDWLNLCCSITDSVGDILVMSLPFPVIKTLQPSRRDKVGVSVVFLLGTL